MKPLEISAEEKAPPKLCPCCTEYYDEEKDPYHLENCREAQRP